MVLAFLLATQAGLFPSVGWITLGRMPGWNLDTFIDIFQHYCLPFLSLFIVYLGGWATGMRSMIIHEMDSGYVRYSDQLGFRKSKSMSYAKRNAILPQFTGINLYLNALIGETAIIEIIFGWPGIGRLMYDAVTGNNVPMIIGCFLVIMVVVIFGNFLIDILYGFVDPRIRIGRG
jgi:peptide/nickel transport system permease protein